MARNRNLLAVQRRKFFFPFVLPAFIFLLIFIVGPMAATVWIGFNTWRGYGPMTWVGLRNYEVLFSDPTFAHAVGNTLLIFGVGGVAIFVGSFLFTLLVRDMRGRGFARAVIFFPFIVPGIVLGVIWGFLFQYDGLLNTVLGGLGQPPVVWLQGDLLFPVILAGIIWVSMGLFCTMILAGVDRIPTYLYEDATLAGASALEKFWYITLPLSWDVVSVSAVLWTMNSLKIFEFIYVFGGTSSSLPPPAVWNSALFVYGSTFGGLVPSYQFGYASASVVVMLALFGVLAFLVRRLMKREPIEF